MDVAAGGEMSGWRDLAAQLEAPLDALASDEALEAVGALEALKARALRGALRSEAPRLLTVSEAATLVRVPQRRLWSWSRGRDWAIRVTRRHMLVNEPLFLAWLASKSIRKRARRIA